MEEESEVIRLLERARTGDTGAVGELFARHRDRLRRMVEMRLDQRVRARLDPSDVMQEAHTDVIGRLADPELPCSFGCDWWSGSVS